MVLLLNHDILSEVLVHFRIWECIEILTTSRAWYFQPILWRFILSEHHKIGPIAYHSDFPPPDINFLELRRVAFCTAALQKNLSRTSPICRSVQTLELSQHADDTIICLVPGAEILLTYRNRGERALSITCWDVSTEEVESQSRKIGTLTYSGTANFDRVRSYPSRYASGEPAGRYSLAFVLVTSEDGRRNPLHSLVVVCVEYFKRSAPTLVELCNRPLLIAEPISELSSPDFFITTTPATVTILACPQRFDNNASNHVGFLHLPIFFPEEIQSLNASTQTAVLEVWTLPRDPDWEVSVGRWVDTFILDGYLYFVMELKLTTHDRWMLFASHIPLDGEKLRDFRTPAPDHLPHWTFSQCRRGGNGLQMYVFPRRVTSGKMLYLLESDDARNSSLSCTDIIFPNRHAGEDGSEDGDEEESGPGHIYSLPRYKPSRPAYARRIKKAASIFSPQILAISPKVPECMPSFRLVDYDDITLDCTVRTLETPESVASELVIIQADGMALEEGRLCGRYDMDFGMGFVVVRGNNGRFIRVSYV